MWGAGLAGLAVLGRDERWREYDPALWSIGWGELGDALLAPAVRWDATWFLTIADDGYEGGSRPAFFPLYPMLVRVLGALVGLPAAGILVSLAASLVALAVIHRLAERELGAGRARAAVLVVAFFPTSVFLSAVYSEGLFLALSAGAFWAAKEGRMALAGALGALAAATRSIGVGLIVPLLLIRRSPWVALVPLGLLGYCVFLAANGLPFDAPFRAQEVWFREWAGPLGAIPDGLGDAWGPGTSGRPWEEMARRALLDAAFLVFAAVALAGAFRRLPVEYGAWASLALLAPLSFPVPAQPLLSFPRFVLVLFPLQLWLAAAAGMRAVPVCAGLLAVLSAWFASWEFVA